MGRTGIVHRALATIGIVAVAIVLALALAMSYGASQWGRQTAAMERALEDDLNGATGECDARPTHYDPAMIAALPPPVQRFFRRVLTPGQPLVVRADLSHEGEFALEKDAWHPFTSRQRFVVRSPGFVWDAAIRMFPIVPVRVRDAYHEGEGSMLAAVAGIVKIVDQSGTPGLASGALLRYLAEAAWLPTALLPCEGVVWSAIDDSTARASLTDHGVTVSMDAHFAPGGELTGISAQRERDVNGTSVLTPWEAHHSRELMTVDGMRIPVSGEVSWLLPEGKHTYWRARITSARFDLRR